MGPIGQIKRMRGANRCRPDGCIKSRKEVRVGEEYQVGAEQELVDMKEGLLSNPINPYLVNLKEWKLGLIFIYSNKISIVMRVLDVFSN